MQFEHVNYINGESGIRITFNEEEEKEFARNKESKSIEQSFLGMLPKVSVPILWAPSALIENTIDKLNILWALYDEDAMGSPSGYKRELEAMNAQWKEIKEKQTPVISKDQKTMIIQCLKETEIRYAKDIDIGKPQMMMAFVQLQTKLKELITAMEKIPVEGN